MAKETVEGVDTVEGVAERVADGTMDVTDAGRIIAGLVTLVPVARTEAERMERYYEGHHEAAIETDPNSFIHVSSLYYGGGISESQMKALEDGLIEDLPRERSISGGRRGQGR